MALITLPTKFSFTAVERFQLTRASNVMRSRYTGQGQRVVYPFAVWEFEGKLVEYDGAEAAAIRSFLVQLEGQKHTFKLPVPGYSRPSSGFPYNGNTIVATAPARATSVTIYTDTPAGNVPFLNEGDFFTINNELKIATSSTALDAGGGAVVSFKPALRKAVATNTPVVLQNPYCLMHAADDEVASWGLSAPIRHGISLSAIEAIDV